ncbi:MAG: hypothetical protein ACREA2_10530 [Blastocatellia bacterium]
MRHHVLKFRSLAMIILAVIVMSPIAAAQRRSRPKPKPAPSFAPAPAKRPVTVNLKQGDQVTGNFLRADAETMLVEIRSGQLTIKMSEVASLVFSEEGERENAARPAEEEAKDPETPAPDPSLAAARKAYAELRKLAEAANIKLPLGQYGNLLIETKTVVEEALTEISDYSLKNEIARALEAYYDAGQAWGAARAYDTSRMTWGAARVIEQRIPINSEPGATLMRKYQIKPGVNRLAQPDHLELDTALKAIWAVAGARLNYVAALVRQ